MIERDFISFFGLSGLLSRSCNIRMDARFSGYEFYLSLDYAIFIAYNGDCLDRYILRYNEMIEPRRIIYAICFAMLKSRIYRTQCSMKNNRMNKNNEVMKGSLNMELLIIELLIQILPFIAAQRGTH